MSKAQYKIKSILRVTGGTQSVSGHTLNEPGMEPNLWNSREGRWGLEKHTKKKKTLLLDLCSTGENEVMQIWAFSDPHPPSVTHLCPMPNALFTLNGTYVTSLMNVTKIYSNKNLKKRHSVVHTFKYKYKRSVHRIQRTE